jgi:hypothetical protein
MQLFHFYVTESHRSLRFEDTITDSLWRDDVPRVAFSVCAFYFALIPASDNDVLASRSYARNSLLFGFPFETSSP